MTIRVFSILFKLVIASFLFYLVSFFVIKYFYPDLLQELELNPVEQIYYTNKEIKVWVLERDFVFHGDKYPIISNSEDFIISRAINPSIFAKEWDFNYSLSRRGKLVMSQTCPSVPYRFKEYISPIRIVRDCDLGKLYEDTVKAYHVLNDESEKLFALHETSKARELQRQANVDNYASILIDPVLFFCFTIIYFMFYLKYINGKYHDRAIALVKLCKSKTITISYFATELDCSHLASLLIIEGLEKEGLISKCPDSEEWSINRESINLKETR